MAVSFFLLPLVVVWLAALALALLIRRPRMASLLAIAALAVAAVGLCVVLAMVMRHGARDLVVGGWAPGVGIRLRADVLSVLFALASYLSLLAALTFEVLRGEILRRRGARLFPLVVLALAVGLGGLFFTADVFNFYVFFEISMVSSFVLAAYGGAPREIRSATVFTVVNLVGSVLFLVGIAGLYRVAGTLDMSLVAEYLATQAQGPPLLVALVVFLAFSLKLGMFPFHFWVPAVYRETRPVVAAILSGALVNIGSYGVIRFGGEVFTSALDAGAPLLIVLGGASILYGGVLATGARVAAETLAYSSIGQAGYLMVAVGVGGQAGFAAAVLYALINVFDKTLLFLCLGARGPLVGAAFAAGAFSLAGMPPCLGFLGKLAIFELVAVHDRVWLGVLFFLGSALSFVYMFRAYQRGWWEDAAAETDSDSEAETDSDSEADAARLAASPLGTRLLVAVLAGIIVLAGIWPWPWLVVAQEAARELLQGGP